MSSAPMNKTHSRLAMENYGFVAVLAMLLGVVSYGSGDAPGLVALKMLMSPFFVLGNRAISTYFREPIVEPFWSVRSVEFTLLRAAVFAAFMTFMLWNPSREVVVMVTDWIRGFAIMGELMLAMLALRIRDLQKGGRAH